MSSPFRFGVVSSVANSRAQWVTNARIIEELGYATLLVIDRLTFGLAPFTAAAIAAEATSSLRIGSFVFSNAYRHPAILAKEVATLDLLSQGRFELGIGPGVSSEDSAHLGLPVESASERVSRFGEALEIISRCFTQEKVDFAGKYYTVQALQGVTNPLQKLFPPIFIGCTGKRMLSLAGRYASSVAINPRFRNGEVDLGDAAPEIIDEKLAHLREAAGERFSQLELCQTIQHMEIIDSPAKLIQYHGAPRPSLQLTIEQAVEYLRAQRERFGFSYFQIYGGQIHNFAPIVARLAGK